MGCILAGTVLRVRPHRSRPAPFPAAPRGRDQQVIALHRTAVLVVQPLHRHHLHPGQLRRAQRAADAGPAGMPIVRKASGVGRVVRPRRAFPDLPGHLWPANWTFPDAEGPGIGGLVHLLLSLIPRFGGARLTSIAAAQQGGLMGIIHVYVFCRLSTFCPSLLKSR